MKLIFSLAVFFLVVSVWGCASRPSDSQVGNAADSTPRPNLPGCGNIAYLTSNPNRRVAGCSQLNQTLVPAK